MRARPQDGNGGPVERDGHRGSETVGDGGEEPWRHERSGLHVTNVERPGLSARADIFAKHLYLGRFYLEFCRERQIFDGMNNNNRIVSVNITTTRSMLGAILPLVLLSFPDAACGYSVLTHQALVDIRRTCARGITCSLIKPLEEDPTPETVKPFQVSLVKPVACHIPLA